MLLGMLLLEKPLLEKLLALELARVHLLGWGLGWDRRKQLVAVLLDSRETEWPWRLRFQQTGRSYQTLELQ
jgi:hypothetical protein